jgi:hypothetical protein
MTGFPTKSNFKNLKKLDFKSTFNSIISNKIGFLILNVFYFITIHIFSAFRFLKLDLVVYPNQSFIQSKIQIKLPS